MALDKGNDIDGLYGNLDLENTTKTHQEKENDLDLYEDYIVSADEKKIDDRIKSLESKLKCCEKQNELLINQCLALKTDNETILKNMGSVWKTAYNVIGKKQQELLKAKKDHDALIFKRARREVSKDELDRAVSHIAAYQPEEFNNFLTVMSSSEEPAKCNCRGSIKNRNKSYKEFSTLTLGERASFRNKIIYSDLGKLAANGLSGIKETYNAEYTDREKIGGSVPICKSVDVESKMSNNVSDKLQYNRNIVGYQSSVNSKFEDKEKYLTRDDEILISNKNYVEADIIEDKAFGNHIEGRGSPFFNQPTSSTITRNKIPTVGVNCLKKYPVAGSGMERDSGRNDRSSVGKKSFRSKGRYDLLESNSWDQNMFNLRMKRLSCVRREIRERSVMAGEENIKRLRSSRNESRFRNAYGKNSRDSLWERSRNQQRNNLRGDKIRKQRHNKQGCFSRKYRNRSTETDINFEKTKDRQLYENKTNFRNSSDREYENNYIKNSGERAHRNEKNIEGRKINNRLQKNKKDIDVRNSKDRNIYVDNNEEVMHSKDKFHNNKNYINIRKSKTRSKKTAKGNDDRRLTNKGYENGKDRENKHDDASDRNSNKGNQENEESKEVVNLEDRDYKKRKNIDDRNSRDRDNNNAKTRKLKDYNSRNDTDMKSKDRDKNENDIRKSVNREYNEEDNNSRKSKDRGQGSINNRDIMKSKDRDEKDIDVSDSINLNQKNEKDNDIKKTKKIYNIHDNDTEHSNSNAQCHINEKDNEINPRCREKTEKDSNIRKLKDRVHNSDRDIDNTKAKNGDQKSEIGTDDRNLKRPNDRHEKMKDFRNSKKRDNEKEKVDVGKSKDIGRRNNIYDSDVITSKYRDNEKEKDDVRKLKDRDHNIEIDRNIIMSNDRDDKNEKNNSSKYPDHKHENDKHVINASYRHRDYEKAEGFSTLNDKDHINEKVNTRTSKNRVIFNEKDKNPRNSEGRDHTNEKYSDCMNSVIYEPNNSIDETSKNSKYRSNNNFKEKECRNIDECSKINVSLLQKIEKSNSSQGNNYEKEEGELTDSDIEFQTGSKGFQTPFMGKFRGKEFSSPTLIPVTSSCSPITPGTPIIISAGTPTNNSLLMGSFFQKSSTPIVSFLLDQKMKTSTLRKNVAVEVNKEDSQTENNCKDKKKIPFTTISKDTTVISTDSEDSQTDVHSYIKKAFTNPDPIISSEHFEMSISQSKTGRSLPVTRSERVLEVAPVPKVKKRVPFTTLTREVTCIASDSECSQDTQHVYVNAFGTRTKRSLDSGEPLHIQLKTNQESNPISNMDDATSSSSSSNTSNSSSSDSTDCSSNSSSSSSTTSNDNTCSANHINTISDTSNVTVSFIPVLPTPEIVSAPTTATRKSSRISAKKASSDVLKAQPLCSVRDILRSAAEDEIIIETVHSLPEKSQQQLPNKKIPINPFENIIEALSSKQSDKAQKQTGKTNSIAADAFHKFQCKKKFSLEIKEKCLQLQRTKTRFSLSCSKEKETISPKKKYFNAIADVINEDSSFSSPTSSKGGPIIKRISIKRKRKSQFGFSDDSSAKKMCTSPNVLSVSFKHSDVVDNTTKKNSDSLNMAIEDSWKIPPEGNVIKSVKIRRKKKPMSFDNFN